MLSSKKLKPHILAGGIFISLFFVIVIVISHSSASAQGLTSPDVAGTGLSDRSLPDTILNIINIALGFMGILAVAVLIYGGYVWMTSGGIPQRIVLAKKILLSAVIGLVIILTSWAIVNFIINGMNGGPGGPGVVVLPPPPLPGASSDFKVIEYSPKNSGVAICMPIQVIFNANLDCGTVNTSTVHLRLECTIGGDTQCVNAGLGNCNVTINAKKYCGTEAPGNFTCPQIPLKPVSFKFDPTNELEKNSTYLATLDDGPGGIKNASNKECVGSGGNCKEWEFTTSDQSDVVPPKVSKVSPLDAANGVCRLKAISSVFSEDMDLGTLYDPAAFSVSSAGVIPLFNTDASFTILRKSPASPYDANAAYVPLLKADIITDACGNKLDGDEDGAAENSPIDDYAPPPIGTAKDWSFTTGETTQCVPKINNINPTTSYYDNPNNVLTITGENFEDIPDPLSPLVIADNVIINTGTLACFNGAYDQTNQTCLNLVDWTDDSIAVKTPAAEGDSNGAITGPIKVQVGSFSCDGSRTCKGGTNKGLSCTTDLECPGSVCGTASCGGGVNSGIGCDVNTDCPGAESAGVTIKVSSPYIKKLAPTTLGAGSPVGIFGKQFGNTPGTVDLIDGVNRIPLVLPCGDNSWTDSYIVAEAPLNTPVGNYTIQVIDSSGRHSNLGSLTVTNNPPGPLLCPIADFCSSGVPVNFTATGKRLGDDKGGDDDVEFVDSLDNIDNATIANPVSDWSDIQITGDTPILTDDDYSARVALDKGAADERRSNSIPFNVPCAGRPNVLLSNACPGSSPNPRPNSAENCINLQYVSARFNQDMDDGDLINSANISLWQCNAGAVFGGSASCMVNAAGSLSVQNISPSSDEVQFSPTAPLTQNTWYEFRISGNVRSAGGLAMNDDKTYPFHIRNSGTECQTNAIDVLPNSASVAILGTKDFSANELDANTCNVLKPSTAAWQSWVSGNLAAATVIGVPANTDTATGVANGTANISAFLDSNGTILTDSSILKVGTGVAGGISCNNNNIREAPEECDGTDIGVCAPATQSCALKVAPCACQAIPTITATDWCKDGGGLAGKNTAITVKFSALMDQASFKIDTGSGGTVSLTQAGVFIVGSLKISSNGTTTDATFYPDSQLGDDLDYVFTITGGVTGVLSKYGIPMAGDSVSNFTTGTNLCKIDKVTIILEKDFNPDPDPNLGVGYVPQKYSGPDLFTCAGKDNCPDDFNIVADGQNQHKATAESRDANGILLSNAGIAYSWTKSTDAPFTLVEPDLNDEDLMIQSDPKSGIGALTVKADGGLAGIKTASTNVTVAPCDNPWPPAPNLNITYPFQDNGANPTNFSLWYCRDAGVAGTADDLPALSIISKNGAGELVKELFFYDNANPNDALGLRVYSNTSHWSAKNWFEKRAPNKQGTPSSTTVDGWQAVQAGRTIYVNAANHIAGSLTPTMNIYLMSHSDKISNNLKSILNQLKTNWKFAITEYDDGTDGTALNPAAPQHHLRKLQRDTKRLTDLYDAAIDLYEYKITKGKYPLLPAGSYLNGHSTSVWPSWDGALSKEVGAPMPHDPISQMSSLIGWWKLDEGVGVATANDGLAGFGGVLNGGLDTTGWRSGTACKYGNCLELNGTSDYIDAGNFSGMYSNKLTVAAWIKTKPNAGWDAIVAGECGNFVFAVGDGNLKIEDQCGNTDNIGTDMNPLESNKKIDDDKWHYVAATYDGLVMKLYIDGAFEAAGPANGNFLTTTGSLDIGSAPIATPEYFDGSIDEVRIWNTPLSDTEINNLYKSNAAKFGSSEDSGWDQTKNAFSCNAGADYDTHIYHYVQENNTSDFSIYAALEYVGNDISGSTWRQPGAPFNPCSGIGSSNCPCYNYRQDEVIPTDLGLCGNGQWDSSFGEACEKSILDPNLNGLGSRICSTGKCSGGTNDGGVCTDNLQCPGGACTPDAPTCDAACQPFCAGAPVVKAVCKNGKIESPIENCECSDFNNPATCNTAKGLMNEYYCYSMGADVTNDLVSTTTIDDTFLKTVSCSSVSCNLICPGGSAPIRAEINNGFWEPWIGEQCDAKRGYCSNNSNTCSQDSDCGGGNCIAIGNGGYYCTDSSAIKCNNGVRSCDSGTLTSCIGGNDEWLSCGGDAFSPATGPYNYLNNPDGTNLYGWCFR